MSRGGWDGNHCERRDLCASLRGVACPCVTDRGGTRTLDQRINVPMTARPSDDRKSNPTKDERTESTHKRTRFDPNLRHDICQTDSDLAAVIDAWPQLPETIRTGIVAMVWAASSSGE